MALIEHLGARPRVVALRALGLGDTLTAVPAMRALAGAVPELRLTVAMPAPLSALLDLAELDADVLPRGGLDEPPPPGAVPLAVNLHGSGPQSHRWLAGVRPDRMVAFGCPEAGVGGPQWDDAEHERDRWCRLVAGELGVSADPDDVRFHHVTHEPLLDGAGYAVVHPGAASVARRWPVRRYADVVDDLVERGLRVLVTGGPAERPLVDELVRLSGNRAGVVATTGTDLDQLARIVAGARLLVCGDTGLAHLASATGTPSVVLFGPTSPGTWGPPTTGPHRALWHGATGNPHAAAVDPGLLAIGVPEVLAATTDLLRLVSAPAPPARSGWRGGTSGRRSASAATSRAAPLPARP